MLKKKRNATSEGAVKSTCKTGKKGGGWKSTEHRRNIWWHHGKGSVRVHAIYGCLGAQTRWETGAETHMLSLSALSQNMCTCPKLEHSSLPNAAYPCAGIYRQNSCGLTWCHCFVPFHLRYLCTKQVLPTTFPLQCGNGKLLATRSKPHDLSSMTRICNSTT